MEAPVNQPSSTMVSWYSFSLREPDIPVLIEWDNDIPTLDILLDEAARAEHIRTTGNAEVA